MSCLSYSSYTKIIIFRELVKLDNDFSCVIYYGKLIYYENIFFRKYQTELYHLGNKSTNANRANFDCECVLFIY